MSIFFSTWDIGKSIYNLAPKREKLPPPQKKPVFLQDIHNGLEKAYQYRIIPPKEYNLKDEENLRDFLRALARIQQEYPKEYNEYLEAKKSADKNLDSQEEIVGHFVAYASRGCCSGMVNSLFHSIYIGQCKSLAEGANALENEQFYFMQLLEYIRPKLPFQEYVLKSIKGDHISKNLHWNAFPESSRFCANANTLTYRNTLGKLAFQFPGCQDFVGVVKISGRPVGHIFAFQYGPQGYYLYDSLNPHFGLFSFPNEEAFFNALREHTRYDFVSTCLSNVHRSQPNDTKEEVLQRVEKMQSSCSNVTLALRPLDQISPCPCVEVEDAAAAV